MFAPRNVTASTGPWPVPRPTILDHAWLRASNDLCRSDDAKDVDKAGHLVDQLSVSIVFAPFRQDNHGNKARSDLFKPAGVFQDTIYCGHRMTHPLKLRQCRFLDRLPPEHLMRG